MTTSDSNDSNSRPMAEPGQTREGASTGGILSTAAGGLGNAVQRSSERGDDDAIGRATTGEGVGGGAAPRIDLGGKAAPGSASGGSGPEDAAASEQPATRSDNDSDASSNVDGSVTTAGSGGAPRRNRDAQASTVSGGPSPEPGPLHGKNALGADRRPHRLRPERDVVEPAARRLPQTSRRTRARSSRSAARCPMW